MAHFLINAGAAHRIIRAAAIAGLGLAGLVLTACGARDTKAGGIAECTLSALNEATTAYANSLGSDSAYTLDGVLCAGGWAVTSGTLGPKDPPADGPQGAPTALIFQLEGQSWVPQEQAAVCGTYNPDKPDAFPADALISEAVYREGCLT